MTEPVFKHHLGNTAPRWCKNCGGFTDHAIGEDQVGTSDADRPKHLLTCNFCGDTRQFCQGCTSCSLPC